MLEILKITFHPVNLPFTVMLGMMLLYWLMVILGALDMDFLNIELDADADVDADTGMSIEGAGGGLRGFMAFFYIGEVPIMILASLFILCGWFFSIIGNHYLNPDYTALLGFGVLIGSIVVSIFAVKLVAAPFRKVFACLNVDAEANKGAVGQIGRVISSSISSRMGQVEINARSAPIIINAISDDDTVLHKGDEVVVLERKTNKGVYIIAPANLED
ncbi:MAG TPA: DUF1449 family protein [Phycisphaerae bacterium]|nr:DUF1449 family protein [Phycisphaerae bacterium]